MRTARPAGAPTPAGRESRPRIVVVSYLAHSPYSPRGIRTRAVVEALQRKCSVELIAGPEERSDSVQPRVGRSLARKAVNFAHSSVLLDRFEPWSWRRFHTWHPGGAGAILIGFPFSPPAYAARRLELAGIPYVVDVGDPWVLTKSGGRAATRGLALFRAQRSERRLWAAAAGAVVTTQGQRLALERLFPQLPILVRPNGYWPQDRSEPLGPAPTAERGPTLRLAHFGDIYVARLDLVPFLERLVHSGKWERVELHQYGSDWTGTLVAESSATIVFHKPLPWAEVIQTATAYDLAMVVGNRDPTQLPSKAVAYLQLPIPRLAVVEDEGGDALADYVAGRAGWAVVAANGSDVAAIVQRHVSRQWTSEELAEPGEERWDRVSAEIVDFCLRCVLPPGTGEPRTALI